MLTTQSTNKQIKEEVKGVMDFMDAIYGMLGFKFEMVLSTRPENRIGSEAVWDRAETMLSGAMDEFIGKGKWEINEGDGAFYGPKIDRGIHRALKRCYCPVGFPTT